MYVMHLNSTCNQNKSIFVEQREEKEVPTKSYGRGNGIFLPPPPPWFSAQTEEWGNNANFFEQPSGQTFPKQRRVVCQCHILASKILRSLHTCLRGFRTPFHKNADFLDDFSVNARNEDILKLTLVCFFRVVLVDSIFISWL